VVDHLVITSDATPADRMFFRPLVGTAAIASARLRMIRTPRRSIRAAPLPLWTSGHTVEWRRVAASLYQEDQRLAPSLRCPGMLPRRAGVEQVDEFFSRCRLLRIAHAGDAPLVSSPLRLISAFFARLLLSPWSMLTPPSAMATNAHEAGSNKRHRTRQRPARSDRRERRESAHVYCGIRNGRCGPHAADELARSGDRSVAGTGFPRPVRFAASRHALGEGHAHSPPIAVASPRDLTESGWRVGTATATTGASVDSETVISRSSPACRCWRSKNGRVHVRRALCQGQVQSFPITPHSIRTVLTVS